MAGHEELCGWVADGTRNSMDGTQPRTIRTGCRWPGILYTGHVLPRRSRRPKGVASERSQSRSRVAGDRDRDRDHRRDQGRAHYRDRDLDAVAVAVTGGGRRQPPLRCSARSKRRAFKTARLRRAARSKPRVLETLRDRVASDLHGAGALVPDGRAEHLAALLQVDLSIYSVVYIVI